MKRLRAEVLRVPEGQIPICRVRGGASHGYCLSPRSDISGLELTAWFLSHVLGEEIAAGDVMARRDLQAAMVDGRFVNQSSGEITTFTIPHYGSICPFRRWPVQASKGGAGPEYISGLSAVASLRVQTHVLPHLVMPVGPFVSALRAPVV